MLIRIGTQKYHFFIAFFNWYDEITKQLNLFELGFSPKFSFVIKLIPLELYIGFKPYILLWFRKNEVIFNNKLIRREN